ncbi:hypothetical protein D3C83_16580 [compost metagenome]
MLAPVLHVDRFELGEQLFLTGREVHRCLDRDVADEISVAGRAHALDALATQPEHLAGLRARRYLDFGVAVERRDFDFTAERRRGEADRHLAVEVIVVARENRVGPEMDDDVEVARRAAVHTGLAFA